MRTINRIVTEAAVLMLVLFVTTLPCYGEAKKKAPEKDKKESRRELTDKKIEEALEHISKADAKEGKRLVELRKKDPEQFEKAIREHLRGHSLRRGEGGSRMSGQRGRGRGWERMKRRSAEHLEWLGKHYPDNAKKLIELKKKNEELYRKKIFVSMKIYYRIEKASRDGNDELVKVLKEDLILRDTRNELREQIAKEKDKKKKEELIAELEEVVSKRFDLILKRKEIAYKQLLIRLEKLMQEIKKSEAELKERQTPDYKNVSVTERLKELLGKKKRRFKWEF